MRFFVKHFQFKMCKMGPEFAYSSCACFGRLPHSKRTIAMFLCLVCEDGLSLTALKLHGSSRQNSVSMTHPEPTDQLFSAESKRPEDKLWFQTRRPPSIDCAGRTEGGTVGLASSYCFPTWGLRPAGRHNREVYLKKALENKEQTWEAASGFTWNTPSKWACGSESSLIWQSILPSKLFPSG